MCGAIWFPSARTVGRNVMFGSGRVWCPENQLLTTQATGITLDNIIVALGKDIAGNICDLCKPSACVWRWLSWTMPQNQLQIHGEKWKNDRIQIFSCFCRFDRILRHRLCLNVPHLRFLPYVIFQERSVSHRRVSFISRMATVGVTVVKRKQLAIPRHTPSDSRKGQATLKVS